MGMQLSGSFSYKYEVFTTLFNVHYKSDAFLREGNISTNKSLKEVT